MSSHSVPRPSFGFVCAALGLISLITTMPSSLGAQGIITTIAGGASPTPRATSAEIIFPSSVAVDRSGNVYVSVVEQSQVVKIAPSGRLTVVAGTGIGSYSGDGGSATAAALDLAGTFIESVFGGIALDSSGDLYITDTVGQRVRRVAASTGIITTVAGNGTIGYTGDGGLATNATLSYPTGSAVDREGNLFIADNGNNVIRRVDARTGVITTYAGNGTFGYSGDGGPATNAALGYPSDVVVAASGNLFLADQYNYVIREVNAETGIITTYAGDYSLGGGYSGDGGPAINAALNAPGGVAFDLAGDLFITDSGNNAIRRVDAKTQIITTVAGNGTGLPGYGGDNGPATSAKLNLVQNYVGASGGIGVDASGDLYIPDVSNNRVRRVSGKTGVITTFAGGGSGGDGAAATKATTVFPVSFAIDGSGDIYTDDGDESRVRRINAANGRIVTVAGNGLGLPYTGDGALATNTSFLLSLGIALDRSGDLFISDTDDERVLRVDATTGIITTIAGTGTCGYSGDGGLATRAELCGPYDVALDEAGDVFIVDSQNERVRRVDAVTGIITTVAGDGVSGYGGDGGLATQAELNYPHDIALDSAGDLYIGDSDNYRLRRVAATTGIITTVAGDGVGGFSGDGGPATSAEIGALRSIAVDALGNVFFADTFNQTIRRVDELTGIINAVAGTGPSTNGISGFSGDGGPAIDAVLNFPYGLAINKSGDLLIGDSANNRVREVTAFPFASLPITGITFGDQTVGTVSPPQTVTMKNTGVVALSITSVTVSSGFLESNNCGTRLASGATCLFTLRFAPKTVGTQTGEVSITDDGPTSPQTISLSGTGVGQGR